MKIAHIARVAVKRKKKDNPKMNSSPAVIDVPENQYVESGGMDLLFQYASNPNGKLGGTEWLGNKIVCTDLECLQHCILQSLSG